MEWNDGSYCFLLEKEKKKSNGKTGNILSRYAE